MTIDPSLAKGVRKGKLRKLRDYKNSIAIRNELPPKKWLKHHLKNIEKIFGKALYSTIAVGKGKHTTAICTVLEVVDNDLPMAYMLNQIIFTPGHRDISFKILPVGITHHAFERVIQMLGTIDTREAEAFLQTIMSFGFTHSQQPEVNYGMGDSIYMATEWGLYIFSVDDVKDYLHGANRRPANAGTKNPDPRRPFGW